MFDSCGPALSAEPWPAPPDGEPPDQEPMYSSARLAERSVEAECGCLEAATALTDLERRERALAGREGREGGDSQ